MHDKHMDILFALYMNGGEGAMEWLVDFSTAEPDSETRARMSTLAAAGLIQVYAKDDQAHVVLTHRGKNAALSAADIISSRMLAQGPQAVA